MKKNIIMLLTLFAFMVSVVSVHAAPRTISIKPSISFDGTTAKCSVSVVADKMSDSVSATLVLWDGSKVIDSWTAAGTGYLLFSDTAQVVEGRRYTLAFPSKNSWIVVRFPIPFSPKTTKAVDD